MPTTRSQSRGTPSSTPAPVKRKADDADEAPASKAKKPRSTKAKPSTPRVAKEADSKPEKILPAILTFDYVEAKRHLISVDSRFGELFKRLPCKPYEYLETVRPFRGQQISWLAARSINHRFRRLYDPSLPEKPTQHSDSRDPDASFPTPAQVANTAIPTLRSAGLSQRKAEYTVQDLGRRFADGSLSTDKLLNATDEELAEMLIAVKGIGRWTVDMFAMFSLRRPNILPVGDLGVQRGLARWVLALHSEKDPVAISPQKLSDQDREAQASAAKTASVKRDASVKRGAKTKAKNKDAVPDVASMLAPQESSVLPTELEGGPDGVPATADDEDSDGPLPPPFTPSVNKVLARGAEDGPPPPLPAGLSVTELRTRLTGKKKIKGALLTPAEMEGMTEAWKPYRSLGVYYMWTLSEGE
ncbi:DNA glycosylase [Schizophyllum commune]